MAKKDVMKSVETDDALNKKEALFIQYRKPILIAIAAILVVVLGFFLFKNFYLEPRSQKASTELAKGQQYRPSHAARNTSTPSSSTRLSTAIRHLSQAS